MIINCDLFSDKINKYGFKTSKLYNSTSFFKLHLGRFIRLLPKCKSYNLNSNLYEIVDDYIILFDSGITEPSLLKWIAKKYKNKKLIFYYWNPVRFSIKPNRIPKEFDLWSYSPNDCVKYNMKYNSTFYFPDDYDLKEVQREYDTFFIGKDKGRKKKLNKLKDYFDTHNIKYKFYITANHPKVQKKYNVPVKYDKAIEMMKKSDTIIDFYFDESVGLSLRAMEALFCEKKIITNNKTFYNYDFYNEKNFYIIKNNNFDNLEKFIKDEYCKVDESIKKNYKFKNWIVRFGVI